jgi:hypothetical protein
VAAVNTDVSAHGSIKAGRIHIRHRRQFDQQVAQLREGAEIEIEVTIRRATRSLNQNAWYWGVIVEAISDYTGFTPDEVHEFLKAKFIPKRLAIADGNGEVVDEYVLGGSTRKMNTLQFGEFCETVRRWAAETLAIDIPDPGDL